MSDERVIMVGNFRREWLYSFVQDAVRQVARENEGLDPIGLEDVVFDEFHRDSEARRIVRDTLMAYIETCVDQARYNQAREAMNRLATRTDVVRLELIAQDSLAVCGEAIPKPDAGSDGV
ncbi:MAG TPA: hypothetical protein PLZ61_04310 [Candidatus Cryosericum sp.]|nr:hypothetical protein [Candidatus Cryosericum sp.]